MHLSAFAFGQRINNEIRQFIETFPDSGDFLSIDQCDNQNVCFYINTMRRHVQRKCTFFLNLRKHHETSANDFCGRIAHSKDVTKIDNVIHMK